MRQAGVETAPRGVEREVMLRIGVGTVVEKVATGRAEAEAAVKAAAGKAETHPPALYVPCLLSPPNL
jgi:hypothetical protein